MDENTHTPFVYLIGWPEHHRFYIGVRFAKKCKPSDLWTTYFTSSKYVSQFAALHGPPPLQDIVATFDNAQDALDYEEQLLVGGEAHNLDHFLNARAGRLIGRTELIRSHTRKRSIEISSTPEFRKTKSDMMKRLHSSGVLQFHSELYEYEGKKLTVRQWAEELGFITTQQIRVRIGLGWTLERALTTPVRKRGFNK